ncbi:MAG: maleylacetoacetate isomerase [Deltaproteobacteria bacterium]|nr:MAG: maleylacetoacetate isomerase [Deltaproteobacteria bacterium]
MKLYGYWRSSSSWRVRIALNLKGLDVTYVPVNLLHGEQLEPPHRARNPRGQVPVLELNDGTQLYESLAIVLWLEQQVPDPALLPAEPLRRARAWQAAEVVNAGIQPLQNLAVLKKLDTLGADRATWAREVIASGLDAVESIAHDMPGDFVVGDRPTVADLCLVPQLYNARRFQVDLEPYPTLLSVEARCAELPAFQAAHPSAQPDAIAP